MRQKKFDVSVKKILLFKARSCLLITPDNSTVILLNSTEVSYWPRDDKAILSKQQNIRYIDNT